MKQRDPRNMAPWKARLWRLWVMWDAFGRDIVVVSAIGLSLWSVWSLEQESKDRRDQNCVIQERKEADDIRQLMRTFEYLERQPPDALTDERTINPAIIRQLPETIREAREKDAPVYCDEPGVGLSEPGPEVPDPPPNVKVPVP